MKSVPLTAAVRPRPVESADLLRGHRGEKPPMVTLATLSRGLGVVALSGCAVVALAVAWGPESRTAPPPAAKPAPTAVATAIAAPAPQEVRLVYGNPDAPRGSDRAASVPSEPVAQPVAAVPAPAAAPPPIASIPALPPVAAAPPVEPPVASAPFAVAAAGPVALPEDAQPLVEASAAAPGEAVDLNTASAEQLNRLDAGMIGRAIVRGRPYASPKELVERRILSRASFEKIRARVVVGAAR